MAGSRWRKWDFHLHSPYSVLNNQFGDPDDEDTWERYVDRLEGEARRREIAAIGITDYFSIKGYKKVREYAKAGRLNGIFLFPNIEFRVDKIIYPSPQNRQSRRLNIHVLFSPDIASPVDIDSPELIEQRFLEDLDFVHEADPFSGPKLRKLKQVNLESFGRELQEQHESFRTISAYECACKTAVVRVEQIYELLRNNFYGQHLIVLAEQDLSVMNWDGQDHAVRKQLIQMAHAIFSGNQNTREFCLGKNHESPEAYLEEFKTFKPCIWGCDSHGFEERFLEPDQKRYCWVKGDVTWEGLKQILFEPAERVRIQEESPEPSKSIFTLKGVHLPETQVNPQLSFQELTEELNPNLVAIIGGRGSGKTALLDLIGDCFAQGEKLRSLENSFYFRVYGRESDSSEPIPFSIEFQSDERFEKNVGKNKEIYPKTDIRYLTQNHFDEYSANPTRLSEHIIELVFAKFRNQKHRYDTLTAEIREHGQEIQAINLEIEQLREEVESQKPEAESRLQLKEGELANSEARIEEIELKQGKEAEAIQSLTDNLTELETKLASIETLLSHIEYLREAVAGFLQEYSERRQTLNEGLTQILSEEIRVPFPNELPQVKDLLDIIDRNESMLAEFSEERKKEKVSIVSQIAELEGISKTIAELHQIRDATKVEIQQIQELRAALLQKIERINKLEEDRLGIFERIIQTIIQQRDYLQQAIDGFETEKSQILGNLEFTATVDFQRRQDYIRDIIELADNRRHSEESIDTLLSSHLNGIKEVTLGARPHEELANIIHDFKNTAAQIYLKPRTRHSEFYDTILSLFFDISAMIEFNGRPLERLSMGERAIVLLKILLALDDSPLLIDQPEEHLDNKYVFNELRPAFRHAKMKRQIIIATHNANLVVNTDADQVIVAEEQDGTITYKAGTLEDSDTREQIKSILEGGDEAFKKREERYGFRF